MIASVFGVGFSLFALSRVYLRFRQGKISWAMLGVWGVVWISAIVFSIAPASFEWVSRLVGIKTPLDTMVVFGLIVAYYLLFRLYIAVEDFRRDFAVVVREVGRLSEKKK